MACEICGRVNCCRIFHSLEEQGEFDRHIEQFKDYAINKLRKKLYRMNTEEIDGKIYVSYDDVDDMIDEI